MSKYFFGLHGEKKRKKYKPVYIYDDVSLNSSENGETFRHSCGSENQNTHFMFNNFFSWKNGVVCEIVWENMVQPDRPQ